MARKREMTDHEYDVYRKSHAYEYPLEEEEGKVRREKGRDARLRRGSERRLEQRLRRIRSSVDLADWDENPELEARVVFPSRCAASKLPPARTRWGHSVP